MSQPYAKTEDPATSREDAPPATDLFGEPVAPPKRRRTSRPAEWPAATGASSPSPADSRTPDRPDERPTLRHLDSGRIDLAATYERTGATLRRADGVALVVCASRKQVLGSRESTRYVRVATPANPGRPVHAGDLYPPHAPGVCDLDGYQFQHGRGGVRYRIARVLNGGTPVLYTVSPVKRRRRGASS